MSKHNNVNPDHYKLAGRERPGKGVAGNVRARSTVEEARERWAARRPKAEAGFNTPEGGSETPEGTNEAPEASDDDPSSAAVRGRE